MSTKQRDVAAAEIREAEDLISRYAHVGDVRRPYLGLITGYVAVGPYDFECVVHWEGLDVSTPLLMRQSLLGRAEECLKALDEAGWQLAAYPRMEFDGSIKPAVRTLSGELALPAEQQAISLKMSLSIDRPASSARTAALKESAGRRSPR